MPTNKICSKCDRPAYNEVCSRCQRTDVAIAAYARKGNDEMKSKRKLAQAIKDQSLRNEFQGRCQLLEAKLKKAGKPIEENAVATLAFLEMCRGKDKEFTIRLQCALNPGKRLQIIKYLSGKKPITSTEGATQP